jgi:hypothetical protein
MRRAADGRRSLSIGGMRCGPRPQADPEVRLADRGDVGRPNSGTVTPEVDDLTVNGVEDAIASSNRRLRDWLSDDEVYLPDLQVTDPEPLDVATIKAEIAYARAVFVGDWLEADRAAQRKCAGADHPWDGVEGPVTLDYSPGLFN